jgi:hypothetical protein
MSSRLEGTGQECDDAYGFMLSIMEAFLQEVWSRSGYSEGCMI